MQWNTVGYIKWPGCAVVHSTAVSLQYLNVNIVPWKMLLQSTYKTSGLYRLIADDGLPPKSTVGRRPPHLLECNTIVFQLQKIGCCNRHLQVCDNPFVLSDACWNVAEVCAKKWSSSPGPIRLSYIILKKLSFVKSTTVPHISCCRKLFLVCHL